jgi:hypothetical protein
MGWNTRRKELSAYMSEFLFQSYCNMLGMDRVQHPSRSSGISLHENHFPGTEAFARAEEPNRFPGTEARVSREPMNQ